MALRVAQISTVIGSTIASAEIYPDSVYLMESELKYVILVYIIQM